MRLVTTIVLICSFDKAVSQGQPNCSGERVRFGDRPSQGQCLSSWTNSRGIEKIYPDDFDGITNKVELYQCPSSGKRVMISNGIPNHKVIPQNPNIPCEINWVAEMPLNPTVANSRTEVPIRGIIAMAINGVPAYGPQEVDGLNAVTGNGVPDARFWYGHAGGAYWHLHNPHMGKEFVSSDTLLGYAMDGFPIYGPLDNQSLSKLDPCNGLYNNDGKYQYHVRTVDQVDGDIEYCNGINPETNWNYILGCYSGSVANSAVYDSTSYKLDDDCFIDEDPVQARKGTKPNIIIMQPDDLPFFDKFTPPPNNPSEPDLKIEIPDYGLPNIDSLRLNGLQMMQAYAASPMCGTSRYSTLTGKYPSRAESSTSLAEYYEYEDRPSSVTIPSTKLLDFDCSEGNIASQFQKNGYSTAMIGKWHLSRSKNGYSYDNAVKKVEECGFSKVAGLYVENLSGPGFYNDYSDGTFSHNMEWITHEGVQFIRSETEAEKPFFMYFNPTVPHSSNDVGAALTDFSCQDTANGTLGFDPMIPGMTEAYGSCEAYRQSIFDRSKSEEDYGPIWVDDSVGALLKALEDNGALENTIFLFQMDHGMETKAALYENGVRISQFVHYPAKLSPGTKFDAPVSTIDIGPTMLDFAGITPSYELDGMSWKDTVGNSDEELYWKNYRCLFFEIQRDRAVRCGCYKYLEIYETTSTTFRRGNMKLLSNDFQNLFNLCGDSTAYVTDPTRSMEGKNLNLVSSEEEKTAELLNMLQCHVNRTLYSADPDNVFSMCNLMTLKHYREEIEGEEGGEASTSAGVIVKPLGILFFVSMLTIG